MKMIAMFAAMSAVGMMTSAERAKGRYMRAPDHDGLVLDIKGKTPDEAADLLVKAIDKKHTEVIKIADEALVEAKKGGELAVETKGKVDEALTGINVLREQLAGIEQKMARKPGTDKDEVKSYGAQIADTDQFKSYMSDGAQGASRFKLKAITAAQSGTNWSQRETEVSGMPKRELVVRNLLNVIPTTSGSIDYAYQSVRTNNAAVVAEGVQKATSVYNWARATVPVRTIAHLAKLTRQALDDAVQLQGEVDQEMRFGLALAEETELLFGDGTGEHLTGLVPAASAYARRS
jgi:HK97 family phage major capsid protein